MKKAFLVIIAFFAVLCLSGCNSTEKVKLNLNCKGNIAEKEYKVGDKFNCELLNDDYEFKIVKFNNNLSKCHISRVSLRDSLFLM